VNTSKNIQTKSKPKPRKQASGKKRQPESARVKHVPSPGTPLAMDDLHEHRSAPSEVEENSYSPHAQKGRSKPPARVGHTLTRDEPHGLIR